MKKNIIGITLFFMILFLVSCTSKSNIIISKYIQNDINYYKNQAIELYNGTKKTVDLSKHQLLIYSNGNDFIDDPDFVINLTGKIEAGKTFVVVNNDASKELLDKADMVSEDLEFDGNDVIHLKRGKKILDLVHDLGDRTDNFKDEIYVRKDNITNGNSEVSMGSHKNSEWDFYIPNKYDIIGSHPVIHPDKPLFRENNEIINPNSPVKDQFAETFLTGGVTYTNDGDTAHFLPTFVNDARVRFLGINTPELDHNFGKHDKWAPEAHDNLDRMLKFGDYKTDTDAVIYLQFESTGRTDTYGRTLAYVWSDGVFTNYEQVYEGYSRVSGANKATNKAYDANGIYLFRWLNRAEEHARINKLRLWS